MPLKPKVSLGHIKKKRKHGISLDIHGCPSLGESGKGMPPILDSGELPAALYWAGSRETKISLLVIHAGYTLESPREIYRNTSARVSTGIKLQSLKVIVLSNNISILKDSRGKKNS